MRSKTLFVTALFCATFLSSCVSATSAQRLPSVGIDNVCPPSEEVTPRPRTFSKKQQYGAAEHEAAHALATTMLLGPGYVESLHVDARINGKGQHAQHMGTMSFSMALPDGTADARRRIMAIYLAGEAFEATAYGLCINIDSVDYAMAYKQAVAIAEESGEPPSRTVARAGEEMVRVLQETKRFVQANKQAIDAIARTLMQMPLRRDRRTLSGPQLARALKGMKLRNTWIS